MMESIWTIAQVGQLEFAATSTLLAIKAKERSILSTEQFDDESDDDSDDECELGDVEEDDYATSRPTPQLAANRHEALIDKFLDRLAEVFSREKSLPRSSNRRGPEHVAATAWIKPDDGHPLTVIVAKNRGFLDDRDVKMLATLKRWLRLVTLTNHCPPIQTDRIWAGDGGLVEYSRSRLWYYISQIQEPDNSDETPTIPTGPFGEVGVQVADMQRLCRGVRRDSPAEQFSSIVNAAYDIRCTWKRLPVQNGYRKAARAINMLGRLRAAYECFKAVAFTLDEVRTMEMEPIDLCQSVPISPSLFQKPLQKLCVDLNLPKALLKSKAASRYKNASSLHVHAEMQVLVSLGQNPGWHRRSHPYIGVSKKLCFLCDQILQNYRPLAQQGARRPTFKARPCHRKVYPLWTLPQCADLLCTSKLSLATAVTYAHRLVRHKLREKLESQPAMAESTAGVTSAGSLSADLALLTHRHIAEGRPLAAPQVSNESEQPSPFGRKIKTVKVGRLLADGSDPGLIPIAFHALSKKTTGVKTFEFGKDYVPDFHEAWDPCQFDRRYRDIEIKDQACEDRNGEYRLYWNESPTLPDNQTVKTFLGIEGEVETMRRFWYGDVFFVKCSEHPTTFAFDVHDLSLTTLIECRVFLLQLFKEMWEEEFLETQLEEDRSMGEDLAKSEADKEILLQRLTPTEQAILKLMQPGTLDLFAITDCDDGATRDMRMENHPEDPSMVRISSMVRRTALETMGWTGFDSSQL